MRELTALEIEKFDFSGRIPELNVSDYQLIGLVSETPMKRKVSRNEAPIQNRSGGTRRFGLAWTA